MCDGLPRTGIEGRVGGIFRRHPGHLLVALGGTARLSWNGEERCCGECREEEEEVCWREDMTVELLTCYLVLCK